MTLGQRLSNRSRHEEFVREIPAHVWTQLRRSRGSGFVFFATLTCCVACWVASAGAQEPLIELNENWRFLRGITEPAPDGAGRPTVDWTTVDFDDRDWDEGPSPFGYETGGDATALSMLAGGTTLDDMPNTYWSVYLRKEFFLDDVPALLQLGIQFDDAYVAYVNGVEIARTAGFGTAGTPIPYDTAAPGNERGNLAWVSFPAEAMAALESGLNVLALQGQNQTINSSDLIIAPQLRSFDSVCPTNAICRERSTGGVIVRWTNPTGAIYEAVDIVRNGQVIGMPSTPRSLVFSDDDPVPGLNVYEVVATYNGERCSGDDVTSCEITIVGDASFRRGDADGDGLLLLTDAVFVLNRLFRGGPPPSCADAADADDDGNVLLTDGVFILSHLFRSGPQPPPPGKTTCGADPTADAMEECEYTGC